MGTLDGASSSDLRGPTAKQLTPTPQRAIWVANDGPGMLVQAVQVPWGNPILEAMDELFKMTT